MNIRMTFLSKFVSAVRTVAIDAVGDPDPDERVQLFETGIQELATIYETSDDGYVRQVDVLCGFLLKAIQDDDEMADSLQPERNEQFGGSERSWWYIARCLVGGDMSTGRIQCGHCGFVVSAVDECPLCEQDL